MRPHRERLDGTVLTSRLTRRGRVPTSSAAVRLGPKREAVAARLVPGERPHAAELARRGGQLEGGAQLVGRSFPGLVAVRFAALSDP